MELCACTCSDLILHRKRMSKSEFYPTVFDIVSSYTRHKVLQRQFSAALQKVRGESSCPSQFAALVVKFLGEEITAENQRIRAAFSTAAADRIIAEHGELFSDKAYEKNFRVSLERLPSIVDEMGEVIFKEKQHVGTVGAFLAFGATLAAYCEEKDGLGADAVEGIEESVTKYFDCHLRSWLITNGGLGMLQSARVQCQDHFAASKKRKVQFSDSLKLVAEHCLQTANPQFYIEMCKLILELQHLLGMNGKTPETWFDYAMFLFGQGNYSGAKDTLRNAIKGYVRLGHTANAFFLGQCHFQMGVIDSHLGHFQEAMVSFQKALESKMMFGKGNMSNAVCHHWLGYLYRQRKHLVKALQVQTRALDEMEKDTIDATSGSFISDSCFELGCIHHEIGDFEKSVSFHKKSLLMREEHLANFKPKLQSYVHLAVVLYDKSVKFSRHCIFNEVLNSEIIPLLEKAVTLCKEQSQSGKLCDQFPIIMLAHTDRLESIKDILSLALKLCGSLCSALDEKDKEAKQKMDTIASDFKNLLKALVGDSYDEQENWNQDERPLDVEQEEAEKVVPPEILARGNLALEAYNKALAEGMTCVKRVPIMLIGQDRAGKTSLKNSLIGKGFNRDEESTVGIDANPSHFKVSTETWKPGESNPASNVDTAMSYEHHTARLVVKSLRKGKGALEESRIMDSDPSESIPFIDEASLTVNSDFTLEPSHVADVISHDNGEFSGGSKDSLSGEMPTDPEFILTSDNREPNETRLRKTSACSKSDLTKRQHNDIPLVIPKMPEEIATLIERLLNEVDKVDDKEDIYSVLWDFGGQSVYYATHPLFLTARAIYLLVFDLSRGPLERAKPVVKQGTFKKFEDSFGLKTNLDYLDFWMSSVASLANQDGDNEVTSNSGLLPPNLPPMFLVCTHADTPHGGGDPSALAREIFGSLYSKVYKTHLYENVFAVNNTKSGLQSECPEVTRLRKEVHAVARELPQMKESIPIKWLHYERVLQVMKEDGNKWITLERARQIASEVCNIVDDKQFETLLDFLHDQRIVIHFDDTRELSRMVVLDPQWLIDVFKKVITIKPYCYQEKEFRELWFNLETTGILDEKLLEHVWDPLFDNRETSDSLVAIMEKFSLLCSWPSSHASCSKQYLVPSMLMSHPPEDIAKLVASAQIPSLFVKFESGHVPPGLFPRLVLQLFQWGNEEFWSPMNPQLYHNFARFFTSGDDDCSVIILCHSSSIEIVFHRGNVGVPLEDELQTKMNLSLAVGHDTFDVTCTRAVCRQLQLMLECMRKEFCWLRNMRYGLRVICPICCQGCAVIYCRIHHTQNCMQEECLHFWSESMLRGKQHVVKCTKSAAAPNNKFHVNKFAPWFASLGEQLPLDVRDGVHLSLEEGSGEKSLAIPDKVQESLLSKSCDPRDVVLQLREQLQVEHDSLEQPDPETKRLIRCLARKARHLDRPDVVKYLRDIAPAGTTGPLLHEHLDVRNIPVSQRREVTIDLSSGEEWKMVAERLGLTPREIRFLDKRTLNPCDAALSFIANQRPTSVGSLYDVLNDCGFPMIADLL